MMWFLELHGLGILMSIGIAFGAVAAIFGIAAFFYEEE